MLREDWLGRLIRGSFGREACCCSIDLYGIERAEFCDDAIDAVIVWLGRDRLDDLGVIADPDEGGVVPRVLQGGDVSIIEPRAASEPISGPIEGESGEQDHIDLCGFHHWAPRAGNPDVVSA